MASKITKKITYSEPLDYFPKNLRDQFKGKTTTKKTKSTSTKKKTK